MMQRIPGSKLAKVIGRATFGQSRQQQETPCGEGRSLIEFLGQPELVTV